MQEQTFEVIMDRMLSRIPEDIDKREGSIIWDALAPAALEIESLHFALKGILQETFAYTSSREYLILRAKERGITPYPATKSVVKGIFDIEIPLGLRFKTSKGLIFKVIKEISKIEKTYELECQEYGEIGNISDLDLVQLDYIANLNKARLENILVYGTEEEDTEHLRERYFKSFKEQAFGGNRADYKEKVLSIGGVGALRVIPVWNGGGTVKLTILDNNYNKANTTLINKVQNIIDPTQDANGVGLAPIGHIVTVDTVEVLDVTISISCNFINGKKFIEKKEYIKNAINEYFENLIKKWDTEDISIKRVPLMSTILNISDIDDIVELNINGNSNNLNLRANQIPKLRDVIEI